MKKFLIPAILVIVIGGTALFLFSTSKKSETSNKTESGPQTVAAKIGTVSIDVDGISIIEPYTQVTLRASAATIVRSIASMGTHVKKGDVVVALDDTNVRNDLAQAEFNLSQAKIELEKAKLNYQRAEKDKSDKKILFDTNAISADVYEQSVRGALDAELALKATELKQRQAELSLNMAQNDVAALKIRAPFDGTVLKTYVAPGDLVSSNAAVALFGDIDRLRLNAEIDEYDINKVKIGQRVTITGESIGSEPILSTVDAISPMAEVVNNISIFTVTAIVENKKGTLRPGMSADFSIRISSDKGLVVPSKAVSTVRGRSYIEVLENSEIVKKRVVTGSDDGINTVILEGLDEGALVVLPGSSTIKAIAPSSTTTAEKSVLPITIPGSGGTK